MGSIKEGRGGRRAEEAIAGNSRALEALRELIVYPFLYSHISQKFGLKWPRGLILYGPPGTGKVLYVPPPDLEGRYEILRIHTRRMKLGADVDLRQIADRTDLFTGADLQELRREAGMVALREDVTADSVYDRHFQTARESLRPSLTKLMIEEYSHVKLRNRD